MSLPFDLEDVVGVAMADVLRRAGLVCGCVAGASFLAGLSLGVGEMAAEGTLDFGRVGASSANGVWLFLSPLLSAWGVAYVPLALAAAFYFAKAEEPDPRVFVAALFLLGGLIILAAPRPDWFTPSWYSPGGGVANPDKAALVWRGVGFFVLTGCCGAIALLAWLWKGKSAADDEAHLVGVTVENERRRAAMREQGMDVADRDFIEPEPPEPR